MLDHLIKGGTVIDGTGSEGFQASIGIKDGKIAEIGDIEAEAKEVYDATGKIVCPGFIDPHTHYDAQLFWDPFASPSNLHGITTAISGNCGFTLAPIGNDSDGDYLRRMMTKVEGMPLAALENGVPWNWQSFGDYLDSLDGKIGINMGFLVGHSAIRRLVMGPDAVGNEATEEQMDEISETLRQSLSAGGMGFSTSLSETHNDGDGNPVPSRFASREELIQLAQVTSEFEGTTLELITDGCMDRFTNEEIEIMTDISLAGNRPVNWNVLSVDVKQKDRVMHQVSIGEIAAEKGARVVALTMPTLVGMNMCFDFHCALNLLPGIWGETLKLPLEERIAKLKDPATRTQLYEDSQSPEAGVFLRLTGWEGYKVGDTFSPENEGLSGRTVADIARERGGSGRSQNAFDTLCDIVVADKCRTILWPHPTDDDPGSWALRAELWDNEHVMIGGSDAGAHLDRMCGAPYTTEWLGDTLRGRKLISLESAIKHMTDVPARLFGIKNRGRLAEGWAADIVVFDPETIDAEPIYTNKDLPGDEKRLFSKSTGVDRVFCNGVVTVRDSESTGELAGTLLRSGRDTETVSVPGSLETD